MRRTAAIALTAVGFGAMVAGGSIAAIASPDSASRPASGTTSETTEHGMLTAYAALLRASAEVPRPSGVPVTAGGAFSLTVTQKAGKFTANWKLTFHNLTGRAAAAHIHKGGPGVAGPVTVPLCGPCRSGVAGSGKISKAVVTAIRSGRAYVNVHTAKNGAGEIRGQIAKKM